MTHAILPGMLSRGKGIVVNVSSIGGMMPTSQMVVYSATKVTFTRMFYKLFD